MDVFVTGATGYIGNAVVRELLAAGHRVTGLVRSPEKAAEVEALGARAVVGDLKDPAGWRDEAARHEALVHTAFESSREGVAADRAAVEGLIAAARQGSGPRSLVYTSGIWVLGNTGDTPAFEDAPTDRPAPLVAWRVGHERLVLDAADDRVATAVVRPGMVYGGSGGFSAPYFTSAEKGGASQHVGDGTNRVPFIHVEDLARFYRAVVERRGRGVFHAVDGRDVPLAEVARAASLAAGAGGAIRSLPLDEARTKMGPTADALALDQVVRSRRAAELGWEPRHAGFVADAPETYREMKA